MAGVKGKSGWPRKKEFDRVTLIGLNKKDKNHHNLALLDRAHSHLFAQPVQKNRFLKGK